MAVNPYEQLDDEMLVRLGAQQPKQADAAGQLVMPFYIICDSSYSMSHDMGALNEALGALLDAITGSPVIDDIVMVSIISFDSTARVVVPLGAASDSDTPILKASGGTQYGAAWKCYAEAVERDYNRLKGEGVKFYRPCVFFLTDGEPLDDDWRAVFDREVGYNFETALGNRMYPFVVAFGFRDAKAEALSQLAYPPSHREIKRPGRWFWSSETSPDVMVKAIIPMIAQSVVSSGQSAIGSRGSLDMKGAEIYVAEEELKGTGLRGGTAGVPQVDTYF